MTKVNGDLSVLLSALVRSLRKLKFTEPDCILVESGRNLVEHGKINIISLWTYYFEKSLLGDWIKEPTPNLISLCSLGAIQKLERSPEHSQHLK